MNWIKAAVLGLIVAAVMAGAMAVRSHLIGIGEARGAARVQKAWDEQKALDQETSLRLQREANAEQLAKFRNTERINDEQALRAQSRARRAAATGAAADGLLRAVEALNGRGVPASASDAAVAGLAQEAATARELLGSCTTAHRELAEQADGLRDQVMGLQDYAQRVCPVARGMDAR